MVAPTAATESTTGTTPPTEELLQVQAAFCRDFLPFLALFIDMSIVTGGDAISTETEEQLLALIDFNRGILRETKTQLTIDAELFEDQGEEDIATRRRPSPHTPHQPNAHGLHLATLKAACEAQTRMDQARVVLQKSGLIYFDRFGAPRRHPAVMVEENSRIQFFRGLRELNLDDETLAEKRPAEGSGEASVTPKRRNVAPDDSPSSRSSTASGASRPSSSRPNTGRSRKRDSVTTTCSRPAS